VVVQTDLWAAREVEGALSQLAVFNPKGSDQAAIIRSQIKPSGAATCIERSSKAISILNDDIIRLEFLLHPLATCV